MSSAGASGFPNDGESMTANPMEVEKFIGSAKYVLSYARISPNSGINWATAASAKLDLSEDELLQDAVHTFGANLGVTYDRYARLTRAERLPEILEAAWRYQHRAALGYPDRTLEAICAEYPQPLPAPIVNKWVSLLNSGDDKGDYLNDLVSDWLSFQPAEGTQPSEVAAHFKAMQTKLRHLKHEQGMLRRTRAEPFEYHRPNVINQAGEVYFNKKNFADFLDKEEIPNGTFRLFVDPYDKRIPEEDRGMFYIAISPAGDGNEGDVVLVDQFLSGSKSQLAPISGDPIEVVSGQARDQNGVLMVKAPALLKFTAPADHEVIHTRITMHPEYGAQGTVQIGAYTEGKSQRTSPGSTAAWSQPLPNRHADSACA